MEQIDMKKLETAIIYIQRIADGKNPINNMPADDDAVMNDPNVVRCMFFVKEVLEEVQRSGGVIGRNTKKASNRDYSFETLKTFVYVEDKPISRLVDQMNEGIDKDINKKYTYKPITDWLINNGYLEVVHIEEMDKDFKFPTEKGKELGISAVLKRNAKGVDYYSTVYDKSAQEFIVKNVEYIFNKQ